MYEPVKAKAHTPPYLIHRYFARRPWNVFAQLIESFSNESDIVLDPFCGGGVTVYEALKRRRKVVGIDLNPLSIFIVRNMVKKGIDRKELEGAYAVIADYLDYLYQSSYPSVGDSKQQTLFQVPTQEEWNELAFRVKCNECGHIVVLSNDNRIENGKYLCTNQDCKNTKGSPGHLRPIDCQRIGYQYLCSAVKSPVSGKIEHYPFSEGMNEGFQEHIGFLEEEIGRKRISIPSDKIPMNWDRQHEDLLSRKGIVTFQDFFTRRNLLINLLLLDFIRSLDLNGEVRELLRLTFSSSLRDTNIMSFTNKGWQSGKPTTWSKHAYWTPNQFCEVNVKSAFRKAYNRTRRALDYNERSDYPIDYANRFEDLESKNLWLFNGTIEDIEIPKNSIDVIITDPPYGHNVQYLELSSFWLPWNKDLYPTEKPDFSREAVSNRKRNFRGFKDFSDYESNLYRVFAVCFKVLKPERYMVLTFNNKDFRAWLSLLFSIFRAGFDFAENGLYFQSGVENYRQTAHTKYRGSPYGDFIYVFTKPSKSQDNHETSCVSEEKFIEELDTVIHRQIGVPEVDEELRNVHIQKVMLEIIPIVKGFVDSQPSADHSGVYNKYRKNPLDKLYNEPNEEKK